MTNIKKEFVAYKFEEIGEDELASKELTWAPVLFPYHPDRTLHFITLYVSGGDTFDPKKREILRNIRSDSGEFVINSVYDACGYNPLFLIAEAKNLNDIKSMITKHTYPRYMSFTTPANIIKRFGRNSDEFPNIEDEDLVKSLEVGIDRIIQVGRFNKENVRGEFKTIGNWEKFVRFVPMNMDKVICILLIQPTSDKIEEVIEEIKKDERIIDAYTIIGESELLVKIITEDIHEVFSYIESLMKRRTHAISKIVLCTAKENGVPFDGQRTPKLKTTLSNMQKDILRYLWNEPDALVLSRGAQISRFRYMYDEYYDKSRGELEKEFKSVEEQFVYKYSTKLHRKGWFRTLLFIKNSLGGRKIVWENLKDNLLHIDNIYFSRKFYAITGDFDFIVPMDFYRLRTLKNKIRRFLNAKIADGRGEKVEKYVDDIRVYFEESFGTQMELRQDEKAVVKAMMPNSRKGEEGNERTPRTRYYKHYLRDFKPQEPELEDLLGPCINAIPTIELHSEKLVHVFVRFKIKDMKKFEEDLKGLKEDREHIFLCREYEPVHNPGSKMLIVTTENFDSLLHFVSSLDKYSRETVTSLIFAQEFYRSDIPGRLRCKPCRLPEGEKCDACPQYIKPREKIDVRDVNLRITDGIKPCTIAVVQLNMEELDPLLPWYKEEEREKIIENLEGKVIEQLKETIENKANIVVFPDMSIQEDLLEKIKEVISGHKIIVIAGTHLHNYPEDVENGKKKYYLTCPVLISNGNEIRQYDVHKNSKAFGGEYDIEKEYKNIKIEEGRGMLRFINTGFGDFSILICYDFVEGDMFDSLTQKIDFLIVPCWNPVIKRFMTQVENAKRKRWFTILANNGSYGGSGLYGPYKGEELKNLKQKVMNKSSKVENEYYSIDVLELDRARDKSIWRKNESELKDDREKKIRDKFETPDATPMEPRHKNLWKMIRN